MVKIEWKQVLTGLLILVLGVVVYAVDRPPDQVYFLPDALSLYTNTSSVFGMAGHYLPTFLHVMAFCLMSSGILGGGQKRVLLVCLFWLCTDSIFEAGQHPDISAVIVPLIPKIFLDIPVLENTANYFTHGQFDPLDLLSILLGATCAYFLAVYLSGMENKPDIKR